DVKI
ncbi:hypothetical protein B4U80_09977, partial [Leptotrombidium deliense]